MKMKKKNKLPYALYAFPFITLGSLLVWIGLQIMGEAEDDGDKMEIFRVWKKNF